ncbi:TetR/AcrR family transcriptional regulator [Demequina litorisediminis]|uniref:Transcriptional regulator, TetR family n=1 Tax=Demequina litorisediminis TaxID=1849022 RepID=A0ABQ6IBG3_9MICO|nr:helix-turn-helix domain-containing protein [Demequina litorisediminis]GMA34079.1 hypothetical protein GCM10025876_02830 [Demequina litorisediminis]
MTPSLLEAIREAVRGEIADLGFAGLTFEGVARRAHTSKPVLYRRFATRAEMAIDAFIPHRFATPPAPVTGHLHDDVVALLSGMAARVTREDVTTMRGIIGEVDESLIEHVGALTFSQLDDWLHAVFDAARARGDLGPQPVPASATRTVVAVLRHGDLQPCCGHRAGLRTDRARGTRPHAARRDGLSSPAAPTVRP